MIQKMIVASAAMFLMLTTLAATADAQTPTPRHKEYACEVVNNCTERPAGGFELPTTPTPVPQATAVPAATTGTTATTATTDDTAAGNIAFTGAESSVLGYLGAGLIGFGTVALAVRRKVTGEKTTD